MQKQNHKDCHYLFMNVAAISGSFVEHRSHEFLAHIRCHIFILRHVHQKSSDSYRVLSDNLQSTSTFVAAFVIVIKDTSYPGD